MTDRRLGASLFILSFIALFESALLVYLMDFMGNLFFFLFFGGGGGGGIDPGAILRYRHFYFASAREIL